MDPNLLPDNLRDKESKEQKKLQKQPAGFGVELNLPAKEKNKFGSAGIAKKPGFWSNLFRPKIKPIVAEKLTMPTADFSPARSLNLLSSGKNAKKMAKNRSGRKHKSGWLKNLLGQPVSPIVSSGQAEKKSIPWAEPDRKHKSPWPEKKPVVAPSIKWSLPEPSLAKENKIPVRRPAGDSWLEIIRGLFSFGRKKRIDFRLASFDGSPAKMTDKTKDDFKPHHAAVTPKHQALIVKPAEKTPDIKPIKSAYHVAPKREKSSEFHVNLMPEELLARLSTGSAGNIKSIIIAVIIPVLIITIGYSLVVLLQYNLKATLAEKQAEFNGLQKEIGDFVVREKENNLTADRVAAIKKLLDEKIIWNNFFSYLEKYTLDGVYFSNLTADTSGVLTLPGLADDYEVLAKQLAVFGEADDFIREVKLTNAQLVSEGKAGVIGVGFQLRLTLQDNVFKKQASLR